MIATMIPIIHVYFARERMVNVLRTVVVTEFAKLHLLDHFQRARQAIATLIFLWLVTISPDLRNALPFPTKRLKLLYRSYQLMYGIQLKCSHFNWLHSPLYLLRSKAPS